MIVVTGGAGFIGSNIVAALAERGESVVISDVLGDGDKWKNIAKHLVRDILPPEALEQWLHANAARVTAVVHMGAISATTERDADLIVKSNLRLSIDLWDLCARHGWPFIYASSAATYGDGSQGFDDASDAANLARLRPLNPYGWSKHLFDRRVRNVVDAEEPAPPKWAGLKFFNVYGPNEYHKGSMRSVIAANYEAVAAGAPLRLFRSDHKDYADGGQMRDFIYVTDCVAVVLWMLGNAVPSDIYNVGTGKARSWLDLGKALFAAAKLEERIEFIDMPDTLRGRYQYFTEATMGKLTRAGFKRPMTSLEDGINEYVQRYLAASCIYA
ncbi:MAG: ADP-glyceromanno-heptose 6-epimerase [Rhodomicrobium sp.]